MSNPTEAQIAYAAKLQAEIRERTTFYFDRDLMRGEFLPEAIEHPEQATMVALRRDGRTDEAKALRAEIKEWRRAEAERRMDAYLARRAEIAETDLTTLDKADISAWIDNAKSII